MNSTFFILENLSTFDGIIGLDMLKQIKANINFTKRLIIHSNGTEKLLFFNNKTVNHIRVEEDNFPDDIVKIK